MIRLGIAVRAGAASRNLKLAAVPRGDAAGVPTQNSRPDKALRRAQLGRDLIS